MLSQISTYLSRKPARRDEAIAWSSGQRHARMVVHGMWRPPHGLCGC